MTHVVSAQVRTVPRELEPLLEQFGRTCEWVVRNGVARPGCQDMVIPTGNLPTFCGECGGKVVRV